MPDQRDAFDARELLAHAAWLRRLAVSLVGPSPLADDMVQDTWTAALTRPPSQRGSLRPWLRVVLQNLVRLRNRGDLRRQQREQAAGLPPDPLPSAEALLARHESLTELAHLVRELDEPYRSTVLLCFGEELTPSEIARRQHIPAGTVRWRLKRGLDQLRSRLDQRHGGDRRAWSVALGALADRGGGPAVLPPATLPAVSLVAKGGMLLVKAKTKGVLVAAAILLMAGMAVWWRSGGRVATPPGKPTALSGPQLRRTADDASDLARAAIAGRVVDGNGRGVAAMVSVTREADAPDRRRSVPAVVMAAPAGGRFAATELAPGRYRLGAAAPGYLPAISAGVILAAGDRQADLQLVLRRGGDTLSGRVLDSGGGTIAGAQVRIAVDAAGNGLAAALPMAIADGQGTFQVTLPRGRHGFVVEADGYAPTEELVQVLGDQTRDFRLNAAGQLSGRVVRRGSPEGESGVHIRLECVWQGRHSVAETGSGVDGSFRLENLQPGDCGLVASKGELAGRIAGGLVIEVAGQISGLLIALEGGRSVSGVVRKGTQPAGGLHVRLSEDAGDQSTGDGRFERWRAEALSGPDGSFRLPGVLPGAYRIQALGAGTFASSLSIAVGDRDVEGLRLDVVAASTIRGLVTDATGTPASGAVVSGRVRALGRTREVRSTGPVRSGPDGRFLLENAGPGAVDVIVDHPALGQAVGGVERLEAGEVRELTIRLGDARMLRIHGRVRWEVDGKPAAPAAGLPVTATVMHGNGARTSTSTDGRFVLGPFPPGRTVMVGVQHMAWTMEESPSTTRAVKLEGSADVKDLELLVPAGDGRIAGVVLGADGRPLPGVAVRTVPGRSDSVVVTGADGVFAIEGLARGTYTVRAEHPGFPAVQQTDVRTSAGETVLRIQAGGRLRGVARQDSGPAPGPYAIWAVPVGPRPPRTDEGVGNGMARQWVNDPRGSFALGPLAPGSYHLYAVSVDGLVGHLPAITLLDQGQRENLVVQLRPGAVLEGRVVDFLSQQAIAGARLRTAPLGRAAEAITGGDGSFRLSGMVPGAAAVVDVEAPGYMSLRRTVITPPDGRTEVRTLALVPEERGRKTPQKGSVGLVVSQDDRDRVVVRAAPPGLPAALAGLAPGDALLIIDGLDVTEIGVGGVVTLLRGDPGTPLRIRYQNAAGLVKDVRLIRM
jgi:RNA polymerase sigma factor (sigma-70 family)